MLAKIKYLALLFCIAITSAAHAKYDPATGTHQACVAYQKPYAIWSKSYKVRGFIIKGTDLIRFALENRYSTNYSTFYYYYVIPWDKGGYTAIKINSFGDLPFINITTNDQHGNTWRIRDGWDFCF